MTRNHGRGIAERESLRRAASERHLGLQQAMGPQEAPNHKGRCPSRPECTSCIKMLRSPNIVNSNVKCSPVVVDGARHQARLLDITPLGSPTNESAWGHEQIWTLLLPRMRTMRHDGGKAGEKWIHISIRTGRRALIDDAHLNGKSSAVNLATPTKARQYLKALLF
jgi:hypothetical protein